MTYAGDPGDEEYLGDSKWHADAHEVVTMDEPHMAPWWFPANDHPTDKALMDISITVPRGNRVISNGEQVSRHSAGRQQTTYRWRAAEPMATYLAFFAAGRFQCPARDDRRHPVGHRGLRAGHGAGPQRVEEDAGADSRSSCRGWRPGSATTPSRRPAVW